jgi:hypothetical protein
MCVYIHADTHVIFQKPALAIHFYETMQQNSSIVHVEPAQSVLQMNQRKCSAKLKEMYMTARKLRIDDQDFCNIKSIK